MKSPRFSHAVLFAALTCSLLVARAAEASTEIKFSDPAKPGTLKVTLARGSLRIHGTDATTTTLRSDSKPSTTAPRKDGLRVLTASSGFNFVEKDNVITLDAAMEQGSSTDYNLTVPRSTTLILSNLWGGDISCFDVNGDIEIKSTNGRIKLDGVTGGVLVETMNGEITADIRELHEGKPLSFTSMNGEIVVRVPTETQANVRLRSRNGAILTDFDEAALITKTEFAPSDRKFARNGVNAWSGNRAGDGDLNTEINTVVHEAVKAGADAAREAADALRLAANAAKDAIREARENNNDVGPRPPRAPLPPMTGGKIVTGTLNGGGPEIQAATMNGDVTLRKSATKK